MRRLLAFLRRRLFAPYVCPCRRRRRCANSSCPYWLVLLLLPVMAFGKVECVSNPDGSWTCSGSADPVYPPGVVVTNGLGVCTNCVQMTQDECNGIKNTLFSLISSARSQVAANLSLIEPMYDQIFTIKNEGDSFELIDYGSIPVSDRSQIAISQPQYIYVLGHQLQQTTASGVVGGANNSIANYYKTAISPALDTMISLVQNIQDSNYTFDGDLLRLYYFVEDIKCEQCVLDFDSGGGSGGGGSGGGSGSDCCGPCVEQLKALNDVVKSVDNRLKNLGYTASNISTNVNNIWSLFRQYASSVTNSLNRIDDYVRQDLDEHLVKLNSGVSVISNNIVLIASGLESLTNLSYIGTSYQRADQFRDKDGIEFDLVDTSRTVLRDGSFDSGEYSKLSWFSRIEWLLFHSAGLDATNNVPSSEEQQVQKKIEDLESSSSSDQASIVNAFDGDHGFSSIHQSFLGLFQGFSFLGSGNFQSSPEIASFTLDKFLPDAGGAPSFHLYAVSTSDSGSDDYLQSFLTFIRYCLQILYMLGFAFVFYITFKRLAVGFVFMASWVFKFYVSVFGAK